MASKRHTKTAKLLGANAYETTHFQSAPPGSNDLYIIARKYDRLDLLAHKYYGDRNLWWIIAVSNECCLCRSRFVSKWSVALHMQVSMNKGKCPIQRGPILDLTHPPRTLACPFSNQNLETEGAHPGKTNTTLHFYWLDF